jgi:endonuclease/exonuclease/phosphatase family metal-dependent hydrolase
MGPVFRAFMILHSWLGLVVVGLATVAGTNAAFAATIRVATYNVENYLVRPVQGRSVKPEESKTKVWETIQALNPDVLALQEIGDTNALLELQGALKERGLDLPYWEHVGGYDTNIFVAVLSRFPFKERRSHTNENFLLSGRRFRVSRGFAEVEVQVSSSYTFTLLTAHLKSKRQVGFGDEAELRLEEAKLLREKVDARLAADPEGNVIVLGDLNDTKDSDSTRMVIGRGKSKLIDTRPAESNGDNVPSSNPAWEPRNITWTHYYGKEDSYSRIDYLLVSPGMAREWITNETAILTLPNWGLASDHRPIYATFHTENR